MQILLHFNPIIRSMLLLASATLEAFKLVFRDRDFLVDERHLFLAVRQVVNALRLERMILELQIFRRADFAQPILIQHVMIAAKRVLALAGFSG